MTTMFNRFANVALLVLIVVGVCASSAGATSPAIQFGRIQYDPPGTDVRTNAGYNAEYFVVKNYGSTARPLHSFTVRDAQNHVYTFPSTYTGLSEGLCK